MALEGFAKTLVALKEIESQEDMYDKEVELRLISLQLDHEKDRLNNQLEIESTDLQNLTNQYNSLVTSYETSSGELHDLSEVQVSENAVTILDSVTSPILEPIEDSINQIRFKTQKTKDAIKDVNTRLHNVGIVQDFYEGTIVDFTEGTDPEFYDPEDFDIKNLKIQLNLDPNEEFPPELDYLNKLITKGTSAVPQTLTNLNKEIALAGTSKVEYAISKYQARNIGQESTYTQEFINETTVGLTYLFDAPVLGAVSSTLAPSINVAKEYATISTAFYQGIEGVEQKDLDAAEELLKTEKVNVGKRFTQGLVNANGVAFGDDFNEKIGGNFLAAIIAYHDSLGNDPSKRDILPILAVIDDIEYFNQQHLRNINGYTDENGEFHPPKFRIGSPEWNKAVDNYEAFKSNVEETLNWGWNEISGNFDLIIRANEALQNAAGTQLEQIFKEREDELDNLNVSPTSQSTFEGGMPVGEGDIETYDYESVFSDLAKGHEKEDEILASIDNIEFMYNLSTTDGGINDQFSFDGDGLPDDPLKVFEHIWGPPEKDPYKSPEEIDIILEDQGKNPWNWEYLRNEVYRGDEPLEILPNLRAEDMDGNSIELTTYYSKKFIDNLSTIDPELYYEMNEDEQLETLEAAGNLTDAVSLKTEVIIDDDSKSIIDNLIFSNGIEKGVIPHGVVNQISGLYMPGYDDMKTRNPDDKKTRYHYNPETKKLYDYNGELVRAVTNNKEHWYFANFDNSTSNKRNAQIQKLYSSPSATDDVLMNYLLEDGNIDVDKASSAIRDWSQLNIHIPIPNPYQESAYGLGLYTTEGRDVGRGPNYTWEKAFEDLGINYSGFDMPTHVSAEQHRFMVEELGIATPFHAIGGGYFNHALSPFHGRFQNVMIRYYNEAVENDQDTWWKYYHKYSESLGSQKWSDWEVMDEFKEHYPDQYEKALKIAMKRALNTQIDYIEKMLDPKTTRYAYPLYGAFDTPTGTGMDVTNISDRNRDIILLLNMMHEDID